MACVERPGLVSFIGLAMPEGPPAYRTAGTMLKVLGWFQLVGVAIGVLVSLLFIVGLLFFGAFMGVTGWLAGLGGVPALAIGAVALVVVVVLIVAVAIGLLFLYWNSWVYAKWVGREPRAASHAMAYAIVTIVFGALGVLGLLTGDIINGFVSVAELVLGIILVVHCQSPEARGWLGPSPLPPRPEATAWRMVE